MTIQINGEARQLEESGPLPLEALLEHLGLAGQPVLVELDGKALLRSEFASRSVAEGARVEIVKMVAGG